MSIQKTKKDGVTQITTPLVEGNSWKYDLRLVYNLRKLADFIEERELDIKDIGIQVDNKNPVLVINGIESVKSINIVGYGEIYPHEFKSMCSRDKWKIFEKLKDNKNIAWECGHCKMDYDSSDDGYIWSGDKKDIKRTDDEVRCGVCDGVLTYRTNGGQSDPFNWIFRIITK